MGENHESLLKVVRHYQDALDRHTKNRNDGKLLHYLDKLYRLPIRVVHLEETGVGRTVNGLRKLGGDVGDSAKSLVSKWKEMVVGEQEEEDDDDEDEEDEDDEDGYQTGEDHSTDSDEKDRRDDKINNTSSSHRKSDSHRSDDTDRNKEKKHKHGSSKSDTNHGSEKEGKSESKREKDRHRHNGHTKHKSHKRRADSSSSDDESPKKKSKRSDDEDRNKKRNQESDNDEHRTKGKKHKTEKHKSEHKNKKNQEESSSTNEETHKSSKSKDKHKEHKENTKDKHKSTSSNSSKKEEVKKHEDGKKDKEKKSKHRDKERERNDESKSKTLKPRMNESLSHTGIDSGSGASFAEALGMCEPSSSSSKTSSKKKSSSDKKDKNSFKVPEESIPKLLKEPTLEPVDINLSSLLPPITPNYRPLGSYLNSDSQPRKCLSESEALTSIITSKNQRTKVYSGNKVGYGKVPSLFELCTRVLQDNIDALEYTGGVPYCVLKPILEKANPNQLYALEHHNPYLIEDTDELWQVHCQKEFKNKNREELETWREMYLRCLDERDAKLKALTANIKQAQDKSLPVRTTKLAYVDAVAKPPRNIARKQAKNGTAFDYKKPAITPSARLNSIATSGEAGKVAVPNPGNRAVDRASGHAAAKHKKAPLMLKSITSFKNRFRR